MNQEQQLLYMNSYYKILSAEQEFIIHPAALGFALLSADSAQQNFKAAFQVKDYQLFLNSLSILSSKQTSPIVKPEEEKSYSFEDFRVTYNGAVLIGCDPVKEYKLRDKEVACYSYQKVIELVFEDGILITTVDQSRAMLRIRKNLELGLRSQNKWNDQRCIQRFLNSSFIGDYKPFLLKQSRYRYLSAMKKDYTNVISLKQIPSAQ